MSYEFEFHNKLNINVTQLKLKYISLMLPLSLKSVFINNILKIISMTSQNFHRNHLQEKYHYHVYESTICNYPSREILMLINKFLCLNDFTIYKK